MSEKPNVLAVVTDQQRWDSLGLYGCPHDLTPNLDAIGERGTVIEEAITPQPTCSPYRATFHTGKYATETGVWRESQPLPEDERTLADVFGDAGYDVGFVGNWHLGGSFADPVPEQQRGGYDDFWLAADIPEFTTAPYEGRLFNGEGDPFEFNEYRVDAFTRFAKTAIESLTEPFFLVVSYLEPHDQNDQWTFVAPEDYADRYRNHPYVPPDLSNRPGVWYQELPDYYGIVRRIDECIGKLVDYLKDERLYGDTVFAYTSDHGCHFRTRPGEFKRSPHDSAVRVPLLFSGPDFDRNERIRKTTSTIDIAPTLLDAADIDPPDRMHGASLLPVIRGDELDRDGEAFVQISESQIGRAIRTDGWLYAVAAPSLTGWRGGDGQASSELYVERYLYDLKRDPHQSTNLVGRPDYRPIADDLRARLRNYLSDVETVEPDIESQDRGYYEY
ncbi:sulfatase-like hydrolase/transferase [Halalkalicoccus subterraneus]|uniref:sulfatase-like hydrolase/transferase n=1 Tax=Halalkalicoccus subterraneus TaxID=2675002 RepID=UPI000EFBA3AC|nr:sulfatase-like hydrolase/transferase [Halalkalicoccus subterraneus]